MALACSTFSKFKDSNRDLTAANAHSTVTSASSSVMKAIFAAK